MDFSLIMFIKIMNKASIMKNPTVSAIIPAYNEEEHVKECIETLVEPILEEKSIGTNHGEELVSNKDNIWARCWGRRLTTFNGEFAIFRAIRKDKFLEAGGFDSKKGYADDQTIYDKLKIRPILAENAICYHNNPNSLKDVFLQGKWIGASYKNKIMNIFGLGMFFILGLSFLVPFKLILNTFKNTYKEKYLGYLIFYPIFGLFRYSGFVYGIIMNKYI